MKTLFLSPLQPQNAGGGWGVGGGGGVGGVSRLRFPPGPHLRSSRFSRKPRLRQAPIRRFLWGKGPRPLVGPGARAPSPLETWPTGPWGLDPATLTDFLQAKFLASCCVSNPWVRVSKRYHNPQSADLAGRWMVSAGGAVQFHERRGSRLRSSISALGQAPSPWGPGQQAPEPCIPVKNSKDAPVLIGS